jgi:hypothetical protein
MAHSDWWLPNDKWDSMSAVQKRLHKISVRAYFLCMQRQMDGIPGTSESDWLSAEHIEDCYQEAYELYCLSCDTIEPKDKIRFFVFYEICKLAIIRRADINEDTELPNDDKTRREIAFNIDWKFGCRGYNMPADITTTGKLIENVMTAERLRRLS